MSTNEHKMHIFHLFCTLNNSNYLYYVSLKNYTQQYRNLALLRPKQDLYTNFTAIPRTNDIQQLKTLEKRFEEFIFVYYNGSQKHEGFVGFEKTCSRAKTYIILKSLNYVHFYVRNC